MVATNTRIARTIQAGWTRFLVNSSRRVTLADTADVSRETGPGRLKRGNIRGADRQRNVSRETGPGRLKRGNIRGADPPPQMFHVKQGPAAQARGIRGIDPLPKCFT
jgi:hypothetical protein